MNETLRRLIPILLVTLALSACASVPILKPLDPAQKTAVEEGCRRPFLISKYRLVHALETVLSNADGHRDRGGQSHDPKIADGAHDPRRVRPVRSGERRDVGRQQGGAAL